MCQCAENMLAREHLTAARVNFRSVGRGASACTTGLTWRHRGRQIDEPFWIYCKSAHHLQGCDRILFSNRDVAVQPRVNDPLADDILDVEQVIQLLMHALVQVVGKGFFRMFEQSAAFTLRIIYGPEYTLPENLLRLKSRGLGAKRSLALREFALGLEALERFVHQEPLRRVHECVFGVLALESEPVDPRL